MAHLFRLTCIILACLCTSPPSFAQDSRNQQKQRTKQELEQLRDNIRRLQQTQSQHRNKLTAQQQALKEVDVSINDSSRVLRETQSALRSSSKRLQRLKTEQQQLDRDKGLQQQALADQIRSAYMSGRQEQIKLILNQQDPAKLARTLTYYEYLNKARAEKINALKSTLTRLQELILAINEEDRRLRALEQQQSIENAKLITLKKDRLKVVETLRKQLMTNDRKLQEWQANEQDLVSILEALEQHIAELIPEQALKGLSGFKGQLHWPVRGTLMERFGQRRQGSTANWSGILIGARSGQEVRAIYHGRVVYSDYLRGFGLITIIDHGAGYMSLYGHNESLFKNAGDWVEAGERIAAVGQTGGYPREGLYFEIRHKSRAINPLAFIDRS